MTHDLATLETSAEASLNEEGWFIFPQILDWGMLKQLREDLVAIYEKRRAVQQRNGIGDGMTGTCHHLLGEKSAMDSFIASLPLDNFIKRFFNGPYILNSFGGFINTSAKANGYIQAVHRDVRTYTHDFKLVLNMLVMLDDFMPENGATWMMPGSHMQPDKPSDDQFQTAATRMTGKAGDIALFDSRLWHAAGHNGSGAPRRALTLTFSRPFFKPQLDYPRFLGAAYAAALPDAVRQVLGYDARVPSTIEEFYQPPEKRAYKSDQG